jgi:hypothetical protein
MSSGKKWSFPFFLSCPTRQPFRFHDPFVVDSFDPVNRNRADSAQSFSWDSSQFPIVRLSLI